MTKFARLGTWVSKPHGKGKADEVAAEDTPDFRCVDCLDVPGRLPTPDEQAALKIKSEWGKGRKRPRTKIAEANL